MASPGFGLTAEGGQVQPSLRGAGVNAWRLYNLVILLLLTQKQIPQTVI